MFARECLSREEFEKRYSSRFADRFLNPCSANSVDAGATWTGDHSRKMCSGVVSKEYEQKALELSGGTAVPSRINSAFFPIGITRQLPDQALGDTAQDDARGDIA